VCKKGNILQAYFMLVCKNTLEVQVHLVSVDLFQQHSPCPLYTVVGHTVQDRCVVGLGVDTNSVFLHWASKLRCHQNCVPPSICARIVVPPATERRRSVSEITVSDLKIQVFRSVVLWHWLRSPYDVLKNRSAFKMLSTTCPITQNFYSFRELQALYTLKTKAELYLCAAWSHTGGAEVWLHTFLNFLLDGDEECMCCHWMRPCATRRKVGISIPDGV
jgi:hypothetical protein